MAARRRHGGRLATALAVSLAVHATLLLTVMTARAPMRGEPGQATSIPVEITIARLPSQTAKASPGHLTKSIDTGRRLTQSVAPTSLAQPAAPVQSAGTGTGQAAPPGAPSQSAPSGHANQAPGPQLKFDCPPPTGLSRPGAVRADPCAFKSAPRDHLPEAVARQARIDSDKAGYYDRVLEARRAIIDDPNRGNSPMLGCAILFGGGQPAHLKKPPHSLKIGPLPCFVIPPEGQLDPEVFVEPPPPKHPLKPGEMQQ
ncbi:MAG TPA: hypothetical protein VFN88_13085 [Caulobacteraceae bacterium]|nr:hypothetical protein [Caulobacteraceae bacterium]